MVLAPERKPVIGRCACSLTRSAHRPAPTDPRSAAQPTESDKYVDGSDESLVGQSCLSDSRDSCFQVRLAEVVGTVAERRRGRIFQDRGRSACATIVRVEAVGLRELRQNASELVRRVEEGEGITITVAASYGQIAADFVGLEGLVEIVAA
jgi:hypothetical protein